MNNASRRKQLLEQVLLLLVIGSAWGILEITLGSFLHALHFPQKGAVMGGLAVSLMAFFVALTGKPQLVPFLGLIAASLKLFSASYIGLALLSPFIFNPTLAIILEAVAFSVVVVIFKKAMERSVAVKIAAGMLAGALGILAYALVASVFGLGMWPFLELAEKVRVALTTALPVALAGVFMLAAGDYAGKLSIGRLNAFKVLYPQVYLPALAVLVGFSWAVPVIFKVGG